MLINYNVCFAFPVSHSLQYVYSGTSGIWNLPEFMIVRLVDGEPFVHYDSNSHKMTPLQEWMAKSEGPDYWNTESQVAMSDELAFENNIEVAKQRFNQTGGIHTLQVMYSCEWDDETGATGVSVYGYDGSDFLTLDLKTMTYVAPVMQAVPTKLNWNSGRAFLEGQKAYHTHICIEWLKKYVSYGKSTLERTVRPEVSLLQKDPSSPVTCHATGFFPKGIVVTWRKDGVDMHSDVEVGETLPNGNLSSFLQINTANELYQSGFRPNHRTETALIKVMNDLLMTSDHGCISLLVLLDLSAAFNTVAHNIILDRIESADGIKGTDLSWFRSYLTDRYRSST
uniref:Ig-like domain-containing protein n=1 Tax=Paramormyrops kingsleyae TaxID=1676925 RepID=A0A3B3QBI2_9TELE